MMEDKTLLEFMKHNLWANMRILDACRGLEDRILDASIPGTYGSIRKTLVHLIANEENYVAQLTGKPPEDPSWFRQSFPGFGELRRHSRASGEKLIELAKDFDPYAILRGTFRDEPYAMPIFIPLLQVVNHATEHRAQVMVTLTQQGIQPPVLDAWTYGEQGDSP
jgi:uncharacterized damage-inducible protein DinB